MPPGGWGRKKPSFDLAALLLGSVLGTPLLFFFGERTLNPKVLATPTSLLVAMTRTPGCQKEPPWPWTRVGAPLLVVFFLLLLLLTLGPQAGSERAPVLKSGHRFSRADPLFGPHVLCSVQPFPTFGYETQHRSRRAVADGSITTINHHHEDGMAVAAAGEGGDGTASASTAPGGRSDRRYRPTQACTGECCL